MKPVPPLGQFEQLVLTAIVTLEDDAYGVTIQREVSRLAAPRPASLGAVYVTLARLEDKGLIASRQTNPTAERGGRRMHEALASAWRPSRWKPARAR
jgi:DNA-binding PadR family transcriptional regulator